MWLLVQHCLLLYDNNLSAKKGKNAEKGNNLPNNKRKYSSRKRINNESDKDHPTNKRNKIRRKSNKER